VPIDSGYIGTLHFCGRRQRALHLKAATRDQRDSRNDDAPIQRYSPVDLAQR
jgi:hypothetical protein